MRKIKMLNRVSIDGYFASNNEENFRMDLFLHDPEVDEASHVITGKMETLLLGGTTYRGFERSWVPFLQDPHAPQELKKVAAELTAMNKMVFSNTLKQSNWSNTYIYDGDLIQNVQQIKSNSSSDMLIMGSGSIVQQLAKERLIDEYIFIVSPVLAGEGKRLFPNMKQLDLTLVEAKPFASGNVILHYVIKQ